LLGPDNLKVPIIALEIEGAGGETIAHGPSGPLIVPVAEMPAYAYEFAGGVTVPLTKRDPDRRYGFSQPRPTATESASTLTRCPARAEFDPPIEAGFFILAPRRYIRKRQSVFNNAGVMP
jgi:hypothetical protein